MNIVTRRPYSLFSGLYNRAYDDRLLGAGENMLTSGKNWVPEVDIFEDEKAYHLSVDLPGIKAEEIEVTAHDGVLTIKGDRESVLEDKELKRSERIYGSFLREFSMPETADLDNIKAASQHGVLDIEVPKMTKSEPKRIQIQ